MAVRALVCGPATPERQLMCELIEASDLFQLVGTGEDAQAAIESCRALVPDVLVIDGDLLGEDANVIATKLALERPLPTLLLVNDDGRVSARDAALARKLRIHRISKSRLRSDNAMARSFARTRLHLLGTRVNEARSTLPVEDLATMVDELRTEETDAFSALTVASFLSTPLDLITLIGGAGAAMAAAAVLEKAGAMRVPMLLALFEPSSAHDTVARIADRARVPLAAVTRTLQLRRLHGVAAVYSDRTAVVEGDTVRIGSGRLDLPALVRSLTGLGKTGLLVVLSRPDEKLVAACNDLVTAGGRVLQLDTGSDTELHGVGLEDVCALLGNAIPRRV